MKLYIKEVVLVFALGTLSSCGSQDYEPVEKPKERTLPATDGSRDAREHSPRNWKENALASKNIEAQLVFGEGSRKPHPLEAVADASTCPTDTLCLKAPYFGEEQLAKLSITYPTVVRLKTNENLRIYIVQNIADLVIDSDIFELPENVELRFCGNKISVVSSEVMGQGSINSSPEDLCDADHSNAADIHIVSANASSLSLKANGRNGRPGRAGEKTWADAKNGDPNAVKIEAPLRKEPFRICVDLWGCMRDVMKYFKPKKTGWDGWLEVTEEAMRVAEKNMKYLAAMGAKTDEIQRYSDEANNRFMKDLFDNLTLISGSGGCFFVSEPSRGGGHSGFVQSIDPRVSGLENLNGEDARYKSEGENGTDGGNAGLIKVTALHLDIRKVEAQAGALGTAGKTYIQTPGKGASPSQNTLSTSYEFQGFVLCEVVPDEKGNVREYMHAPISWDIKFNFTLGQAYALNRNRQPGKALGYPYLQKDGSVRGSDGKSLSIDTPKDGSPGQAKSPELTQSPVEDLVLNDLTYACDRCEIPKALKE